MRAPILCDLIQMAFTCGMTNVASVMFTWIQCFISAKSIVGRSCDFHDTGHAAGQSEDHMADLYAWHLAFMGHLIDKFRSTPDGDGTLLDHSAIVFLTEGGSGADDEGGRGSHSN